MIEAIPCPGHAGCVDLIDSRYPDGEPLHLTVTDWAVFLAAAKAGHYDDVANPATT